MRWGLATVLLLVWAAEARAATPAVAPVREDYLLHCSGCHRESGRGTPGVVPSLRGLAPLAARPAGRDYLGRVPGVAQAPLGDARLARLLNWVLAEFSGAAVSPPYSAIEIGRLRELPLRDPVGERARILGAVR